MKKIIIMILLAILPLFALAFDFENGGIRNAALGGTGTASSNDASAAVWNPALLGYTESFALLTDSRPYLMQMDNDNIYQNFTYLNFSVNKIGTFGLTGGLFNSAVYAEGKFGLHFGKMIFPDRFPDMFTVGASLYDNYINFADLGESKNAFDTDIGLSAQLTKIVRLGLSLQNLLRADMALSGDLEDRLPMSAILGTEFSLSKLKINADVKAEQNFAGSEIFFAFGSEYKIAPNFMLRAGVNNKDITGGFGLKLYTKGWSEGFTMNATDFLDYRYLNITLDYCFNLPIMASYESDIMSVQNEIQSDYGDHFFGIKIEYGKSQDSMRNLAKMFPADYGGGLDMNLEELSVEHALIDTIIKEVTLYDTIEIVTEVANEEMLAAAREEGAEKARIQSANAYNRASVHLSNALKLFYAEDYNKAIEECEEAMQIAPYLSLSYLRIGSIYFSMGDKEEAMFYLRQGILMDPENEEIEALMKTIGNE
jgi:tetratricopeptide (TPR) repeat protein